MADEERGTKYDATESDGILRVACDAAKYTSLIVGVASVCNNEKNIAVAVTSGFIYIAASALKECLRENADIKKFSELEKSITKALKE